MNTLKSWVKMVVFGKFEEFHGPMGWIYSKFETGFLKSVLWVRGWESGYLNEMAGIEYG